MITIDFGRGRPTSSYNVQTISIQSGFAVAVEPGIVVCQKVEAPPGLPPLHIPCEAIEMLGDWFGTEDENDRHVLEWHEKADLAVTESEAVVTLKSGGGEARFPLGEIPNLGLLKAVPSPEGRIAVRIDVEKLRNIAADFGSTGDLTLHIGREEEPVIVTYDESTDRFALVKPLGKPEGLNQNEAYQEALTRP